MLVEVNICGASAAQKALTAHSLGRSKLAVTARKASFCNTVERQ